MEGLVVSSTAVRNAVGKATCAWRECSSGGPIPWKARWSRVSERGREIGFPTANIEPQKELLPGRGVYATVMDIDGVKYRFCNQYWFQPDFYR